MSTTTAKTKTKTKSVKRRARSSRKEKKYGKICKECNQDILLNEKRDMLMSHDTYHNFQAKDYCKDHELSYHNHKCKPMWCDKCRYLINYEITIDHSKWDR